MILENKFFFSKELLFCVLYFFYKKEEICKNKFFGMIMQIEKDKRNK